MNRGTYNQIIEIPKGPKNLFSNPPIAVNVLPPGQNGFVNSLGYTHPNSYDQLDLYVNWEFKPMLISS